MDKEASFRGRNVVVVVALLLAFELHDVAQVDK